MENTASHRMYLGFIGVYLFLSVLDIGSTAVILRQGGVELNPYTRTLIYMFPDVFPLILFLLDLLIMSLFLLFFGIMGRLGRLVGKTGLVEKTCFYTVVIVYVFLRSYVVVNNFYILAGGTGFPPPSVFRPVWSLYSP